MKITYGAAPLRDFRVVETGDRGVVTGMEIAGRKVRPSPRFWTSLCAGYSSYGLSTKLFKLFQHAEVFERISTVVRDDRLRFAIEEPSGLLLAVSQPTKPLVEYQPLGAMMEQQALAVAYSGGIVRTTHRPEHMADANIAGDEYVHEYIMESPIDGFGNPLIYLSLLRRVCSNGAIGYARAFKTEIRLGRAEDNALTAISRAMDTYANDEGYAALRQRFDAADQSWASLYETNLVWKALVQTAHAGGFHVAQNHDSPVVETMAQRRAALLNQTEEQPVSIKVQQAFVHLTGDIASIYGLVNADALSEKRQKQLPAKCTVYALLQFITELATHYTADFNARRLQALVGNLISTEYDLEGTRTETGKMHFEDFFLGTPGPQIVGQTLTSVQKPDDGEGPAIKPEGDEGEEPEAE